MRNRDLVASARARPKPSLRAEVPPAPDAGAGSPSRGGPRSGPPFSRSRSVRFPVSWIEKVVTNCPQAQLGDKRHHSFVVIPANHLSNPVDQVRVEIMLDEFARAQPAIDHVIQDEVGVGVGEAKLALVGLSLPELRGRRFAHDRLGDADGERELAQLRLVEVADGIDAAGHVAELRAVAEEELGLVARAEDDPIGPGAVVLDALSLAG